MPGPGRRVLLQRAVRRVSVVVIDVLTQDRPRVHAERGDHRVRAAWAIPFRPVGCLYDQEHRSREGRASPGGRLGDPRAHGTGMTNSACGQALRRLTMLRPAETVPGREEFARSTEPFRRELLAHCYRMLGSLDEAEDLVQETYLRAWRSHAGFEGRSSLRVWLYRIATNACLTALEQRGRRALPSGLGAPSDDPDGPPVMAGPEVSWLGPIPDALVTGPAQDPAVIAVARESLRLGLIACLQYLPARQRAVLILRDVLAFPAAEVSAMLGTSTVAVKSTLQRARARLEQVAPAAQEVSEPAEPAARALLEAYISAFQNADPAALERVLR